MSPDDQYLPSYMELGHDTICRLLAGGGSLKRADGKIPTRLYLDGDKVLVRFELPLVRPPAGREQS